MAFQDFRLVVQPDLHNPAVWSIQIQECPIAELHGPWGTITPQVTADQLRSLRTATRVPNLQELRDIGRAVLDSIMPPEVQFGFRMGCNQAREAQNGLRLIVVMLGGSQAAAPGTLGIHELPLEAAFAQGLEFVATNVLTPVSRGIAAKADRPPVRVTPPLRILVVASEPTGMPPVDAAAEKATIQEALGPLIRNKAVELDFCEPPTKAQLAQKLLEGFHVVHFIGHGDFEEVGFDPSPQPHVYFEDPIDRTRDPADAEQLYTVLRNGNVALVILTACSSAAASPNGGNYPPMAFESLAQILVGRQWGPCAAVAMQFDLETTAAQVFTAALYEKLLWPGWCLDQAVASARTALILEFGAGHRCWVNPTVYWRCRDGRVFEFANTIGDLSPTDQEKLRTIDSLLEMHYDALRDLSREPVDVQAATANLRRQWQAKIDKLLQDRGSVLGETLRLLGGRPRPDGTVECVLQLRTRLPATIGDISAAVAHEVAEFDFVEHTPGQHAPAGSLFVQPNPNGPTSVLVRDASRSGVWAPGEYELAKLRFRIRAGEVKPFFHIKLTTVRVVRNGVPQPFRELDAVVFGF